MDDTIIERLARFSAETALADVPEDVVHESKRLLLDSIGVAVAGTRHPKGEIGIRFGLRTGGTAPEATIIGTGERASIFGAAFANGELINALDMDAVLPPGHVTPYTLPGALAAAEYSGASGAELLVAIAVSHEMSYRLGKAVDYVRDRKADGTVGLAPVIGYSLTTFGATAAIQRLLGHQQQTIVDGLGIAGITAPVNSQREWFAHAPSSTLKYLSAGVLAQQAMNSAHLAEYGHRGDKWVLDDHEFGFRRFIGTSRWEPAGITDGLGEKWGFPGETSYKPYPHCRILHAPLDALTSIVAEHGIRPEAIDSIRVFGEAWVFEPVWQNNEIDLLHDAQFSIAHGLAVGAHNVMPRRAWQDPDVVFSDSVMRLLPKVRYEAHPDWASNLAGNPAARPTRVEVVANGQTFVQERSFPKGSPSPDPDTYLTDDELIAKFRDNVSGIVSDETAEDIVTRVFSLQDAESVGEILAATRPAAVAVA
ncbi:MmgE/PrpD family protein [Gordonia sp. NPDC003424]